MSDTHDAVTITVQHGDREFETRRFDDGRVTCPLCEPDQRFPALFEGVSGLRIHLSVEHNLSSTATRRCEHCGDEFQAKRHRDTRFCSPDCVAASNTNVNGHSESCEHCGDDFQAAPSQSRRFCSHDCHRAHLTASNECNHCGKETDQAALTGFCSNECFFADSTGGDQ